MSNTNQTIDLTSAVKSIRTAKGWTQARLAKTWGVTVNFVSQIENGRRGVSLKGMETLAEKLAIPVSLLYVLADNPAKKPIGTLQRIIVDRLAKKKREPPQRKPANQVPELAAALN